MIFFALNANSSLVLAVKTITAACIASDLIWLTSDLGWSNHHVLIACAISISWVKEAINLIYHFLELINALSALSCLIGACEAVDTAILTIVS